MEAKLNIKEIFESLKITSSRVEKEDIIKYNTDNELFKKVLVFLLDSNITSGISKKRITKNICNTTFEKIDTFEECMNFVAENNTGSDYVVHSVLNFILSQPDDLQEFYKAIISKSLKVGVDVKTVNKVIPGLIPVFNVMLGTPIDKCKLKENEWFSISHKLNGSRCVYYKGDFYTRQGKKYCGLDHIKEDLDKVLVNEYDVVDGELVYRNDEGLTDSEAFQVGVGIANSKADKKPELQLVIFDLMTCYEFDRGYSDNTYRQRKQDLIRIDHFIEKSGCKNISVVDMFYEGTDQAQIWKWLDYAEEHDLEGVVLNLDAPYECKRSKNLIKVKKFYTMDLEVVGAEEGDGRLKGTLGALIVDYKGNHVNVGSGYNDQTRNDIWKMKDDIIGRVIEVKYKEVSKDKKTGLESLQFPIFVTVREEGKEVSYN